MANEPFYRSRKIFSSADGPETTSKRLERLREAVLSEAEGWEITSAQNHGFISALEEYKACVKRYMEECENKGVDAIYMKAKRIADSSQKTKGGKKKAMHKEDSERVWDEVEKWYFDKPSIELLEKLKRIDIGMGSAQPVILLNMAAVNRLAGIAKMAQYCVDNGVSLEKFKEGRVSQKIRAWHKMHRITSVGHMTDGEEGGIASYMDHEGLCYPLLEELDYLLELEVDSIQEEITRRKSSLFSPPEPVPDSVAEHFLQTVSARNKVLLEKISSKLSEDSSVESNEGTTDNNTVLEKYQTLIPAMKRRREYALKKEKRAIKLIEGKTAESVKMGGGVKSPSGGSETAQDDQILVGGGTDKSLDR